MGFFRPLRAPWVPAPCLHPQHNPPGHLFIPPGTEYVHTCPGCGATTTLQAPVVYC